MIINSLLINNKNNSLFNKPAISNIKTFDKKASNLHFASRESLICDSAAVKNINENMVRIFSPIMRKFFSDSGAQAVNIYNKFRNPDLPRIKFVDNAMPKILLENLDGSNIEIAEFINRKQKHLQLNFLEEGKEPLGLVFMNGFIADCKSPLRPLGENEIRKYDLKNKLADNLPIIENSIVNFSLIVNDMVKSDLDGYVKGLVKEIISRTERVEDILSNMEIHKCGAVKRSFPNYIQFPNKKVYFFKDTEKVDTMRYAFIPHREGENKLFRLVEYDVQGKITDAHLLDVQNGVVQNYCPKGIFNIANISHTPARIKYMTNNELEKSSLIKQLEKYFIIMDEFEQHVNSSIAKSTKVLDSVAQTSDYIAFNKIKQEFSDRLVHILPKNDDSISFIGKDGVQYNLNKSSEEGLELINIGYDSGLGKRVIKFDLQKNKILQTTLSGEILKDLENNPLYYNHYSDAFKIKSKVLKSFITEAFEHYRPDNGTSLTGYLKSLEENFLEVRTFWDGVSKTKKTAVKKDHPALVEARGDVGGLRFNIKDKNYQIGLKPHRLDSNEFMRMTIYDESGSVQNAFLIKDFTSFVHNYCSNKNYTRDALSRIPGNIVYKTEAQTKEAGLETYIKEYLQELNEFGNFIKQTTIDKRLAQNKSLTKNQ